MLSLAQHHPRPEVFAPAKPFTPEWRSALNALRMTALDCRVAARTDLFEACALIATKQNKHQDAFAQALLRCLHQAVRTKPIFFRPGTFELSFDEAWLIRAMMTAQNGDGDSLSFLIRSRVAKQHQRQIAFLIKGSSEQHKPF